jgi:hypothetical protein
MASMSAPGRISRMACEISTVSISVLEMGLLLVKLLHLALPRRRLGGPYGVRRFASKSRELVTVEVVGLLDGKWKVAA